MTKQKQLQSLGIGADAYEGLVLIEIEGPPVVTLTPAETHRHIGALLAAVRQAEADEDALQDLRNRKRRARQAARDEAYAELVPDGSYAGARASA